MDIVRNPDDASRRAVATFTGNSVSATPHGATQILALQVQAQRMAFMTLTGAATFAAILATAHIAEGQQARQDLLMQEMRGPIAGDRS